MDWFFGIIGILSFGFSIYTYNKTESKKTVEAAKVAMEKERFRDIRISLLSIFHSIDAVVQIPKQGTISVDQLQHLARVARAQLVALAEQVEIDQLRLEKWKYGELFSSELVPIAENNGNNDIEKKKGK